MTNGTEEHSVKIPRWLAIIIASAIIGEFLAAVAWGINTSVDLGIIKNQMSEYARTVDKLDLRLERLEQARRRSTTRSAGE